VGKVRGAKLPERERERERERKRRERGREGGEERKSE